MKAKLLHTPGRWDEPRVTLYAVGRSTLSLLLSHAKDAINVDNKRPDVSEAVHSVNDKLLTLITDLDNFICDETKVPGATETFKD